MTPNEIERGKFLGIDLATGPDRTTVNVDGVCYDGESGIGKLYLDALSRISALEAKLEEAEGLVVRLREALSRERSTVDKDGALKRLVREKDAALDEAQTFKGHVKNLVAAYDAKNPMRTADMHDMSCLCLRCVFDHARTALKGDDNE